MFVQLIKDADSITLILKPLNMKRTIFFLGVIAMIASFNQSKAQETGDEQNFYIGVRFLPTLSSLEVQGDSTANGEATVIKTEATLGYGFGAVLGYNFNRHIGAQAEVIYSSLSQKYEDPSRPGEINKINLSYLHIPLLLVLNTNSTKPVNFNLAVGPQLGILVGSRFDAAAQDSTVTSTAVLNAKSGDVGFAYGAGIDFNLGPVVTIGVGYRGVIGLLDISDDSATKETDQFYVLQKSKVKTNAGYIGIRFRI
jgi:opacity protein-like surface antigen